MNKKSIDKIVLTREQLEEVQTFKENLENGSAEIAFEGSFVQGTAFLNELVKSK